MRSIFNQIFQLDQVGTLRPTRHETRCGRLVLEAGAVAWTKLDDPLDKPKSEKQGVIDRLTYRNVMYNCMIENMGGCGIQL